MPFHQRASQVSAGILKEAERNFLRRPTDRETAVGYHDAVTRMGAFARAETVFERAAGRFPTDRRIKLLLIDVRLRQDKFDSAMLLIEEALASFEWDRPFLEAALAVRRRLGSRRIPQSLERPSVSLCMIARDEQANLARCLYSAAPIVDEIILADTGSEDATREVAMAMGAMTFSIDWTDDFSRARNFALSKANGDLILILDPDEVISGDDHARMRAVMRESAASGQAVSFVTRNYTKDAHLVGWVANDGIYCGEEAGTGWVPTEKVRLFVNDARIRYVYPVHEMVEPALQRYGIGIRRCDVPIHHYGPLDQKRNRRKLDDYYRIGKKKLNDCEHSPAALFELAVQAGNLGLARDAIELWNQFIQIRRDMPEAYVHLANAYFKTAEYDRSRKTAALALNLNPSMKEAHYLLALCDFIESRLKAVIRRLAPLARQSGRYDPVLFLLHAAWYADGCKVRGMDGLAELQSLGKSDPAGMCRKLADLLVREGRCATATQLREAARKLTVIAAAATR